MPKLFQVAKGFDVLLKAAEGWEEKELKAARMCRNKKQVNAKVKHGINAYFYRQIAEKAK